MRTNPASAPIPDPSKVEPLVDAETIAPILGCVPATVREWHYSQGLPAFRIGRSLKFLVSEVVAWRDDRQTVVVRREGRAPMPSSVYAPINVRPSRRMTKAESDELEDDLSDDFLDD